MAPRHRATAIVIVTFLIPIPAAAAIIQTVAGGGPHDVPALAAQLGSEPRGVADGAGNLYVVSTDDARVFKVGTSGLLSVYAGNGIKESIGDGGPAVDAGLQRPVGLALDPFGNLFIAEQARLESGDHGPVFTEFSHVRKVDAITHTISTVLNGYWFIQVMSTDDAGNLYVALHDSDLLTAIEEILRIDAVTGQVTRVAGNHQIVFPLPPADGHPATDVPFLIYHITVAGGSAGDFFVGDAGRARVFRVDGATGIMTTYAGNGIGGSTGDGGPATGASLQGVILALDSIGNLFISEGTRIRRVDAATHVITTVIGNGAGGFSGDGGPAILAGIQAFDIRFDPSDNLILSGAGRIRRVDAVTQIITTVAGDPAPDRLGDGGPATQARLSSPGPLAVGPSGDLLIADRDHNRVRRVDALTGFIDTVPGTLNIAFQVPISGIAPSPSGDLFVSFGERYNRLLDILQFHDVVYKVDGATGAVIPYAGNGIPCCVLDEDIPATSATLHGIEGLAVAGAGDLYISENRNHRVRKVDADTGLIRTVAGHGGAGFQGDGGPALDAVLNNPTGLAVDPFGNLIIVDLGNRRIRRVDAGTGIIVTIAGNGLPTGSGDGAPATGAALDLRGSVTTDEAGHVYFSDGEKIRRVDAGTGILTTVAGNGLFGFSGDGGPATDARLGSPGGTVFGPTGDLFLSASRADRVRRVALGGAGTDRPPVAVAAGVAECAAGPPGEILTLDGSGSSDPDSSAGTNDDIVFYEWFKEYGLPTATLLGTGERITTVPVPRADQLMTLRVTDSAGRQSVDQTLIPAVGAAQPTLQVSLTPVTLWPANHQMVPVSASVAATAACGAPTVELTSITSSEPDDATGGGDGKTANDIQDAAIGAADLSFLLRAERDGSGPGRTYTVTYTATDDVSRTASATATVFVPHDHAGLADPVSLSIDERSGGTVVSWLAVPEALRYNVVRGALGSFRVTGEALDLGALTCIDGGSPNLTMSPKHDHDVPPPGRAFFYLVEYDDGVSRSGYGAPDAARARVPGSGGCP